MNVPIAAGTPRAEGQISPEERRAAGPEAAPHVGLLRLFAAFLRLGCTSFGGNTAAWLYREMVLRRRWVDDQSFLAMMSLAQVMPGSNGVKMTVLIGQRLRGSAGTAAALAGLLAGPFAIVLAIGSAYIDLAAHPIVEAMLDGVAAAVVGLTLASGFSGLARGGATPASWVVAAATVVCVGVLRWPLLPVIAGLAPVSIGLAFHEQRQRRRA